MEGIVYIIKGGFIDSSFPCDYDLAIFTYYGKQYEDGHYHVCKKGVNPPYEKKPRKYTKRI